MVTVVCTCICDIIEHIIFVQTKALRDADKTFRSKSALSVTGRKTNSVNETKEIKSKDNAYI